MEAWRAELYHHGILGMQWGKRNGPPYPLGSGEHSSSEKKAGWKKSLNGKNPEQYDRKKSSSSGERKGLTDSLKRAIKIGAAVAVTALAAYGGYKLYQSGALQAAGKKRFDGIDPKLLSDELKAVNPENTSTAEQLFGKVSVPQSIQDAVSSVNKYSASDNGGALHNCGPCSMSICERIKGGAELTARNTEHSTTWDDVKSLYKGAQELRVMPVDNGKELGDYISKKFGNDSSGLVALSAKDSSKAASHFISFNVKDGVTYFGDGQLQNPNGSFGVVFGSDDSVTINGMTKKVPGVFDRYLSAYNLDNTDIADLTKLNITDDEALLKKFFE